MAQIPLPLGPLLGQGDDRIIVGEANHAVVEALGDPASWPFHTAVLSGPPRSGKSLLGKWFAGVGEGRIVIDGADREDETALFHAWNRAQETASPLLLICDSAAWEISLPDLKSRLGAALQLQIGLPDEAMMAELIALYAQRCGLVLGEDAAAYLVARAPRSFAAIERLVEAINRLSLQRKAPANMGIWRDALAAISEE